MPKDVNFAIGINYEECTGCGLCAVTCPGKMGKKALEMVANKRHDKEFDYLLKNNINDKYDVIISNPPYISYDEDIMDVVYNNEVVSGSVHFGEVHRLSPTWRSASG